MQSHYDKAYAVAVRCANLIFFGSKYVFDRQVDIIHGCRADADAPNVPVCKLPHSQPIHWMCVHLYVMYTGMQIVIKV